MPLYCKRIKCLVRQCDLTDYVGISNLLLSVVHTLIMVDNITIGHLSDRYVTVTNMLLVFMMLALKLQS
jgi:hypothetical protein